MDNEINKCLIDLFNALSAESDKESIKMFGEAVNHIRKSKIDINNPENFDCFINHKLKKGIKLLVSTLHETSICKNKNKLDFIYENYSFLENHIRNLCECKEGIACCADKSRYILKMYFKYTLTGEIPIFNPNIEKYYIPNFGDNQMWIKYCDSLYELYYGNTINYFKIYSSLIKSKIRKFKHTLHRWYIEFNDGKSIEFDQNWDERNQNPLKSKDDFYIMHKSKVKDKNFDIYEPIDEEEKFLYRKNYVKIPKSEIKQIYKKSEETMV